MVERFDSPEVMGWPWDSTGDKVSKTAAGSSSLTYSEYKNIDNTIYNAYVELLKDGWGRFDPASGAATATAQAVADRTGLKLVNVFNWLATMWRMAQEGTIDPKYWDPGTADEITPETQTTVEKLLEPVAQIIAPIKKATEKSIETNFNRLLITVGVVGIIGYFILRDADPQTIKSVTPDISVL